MYITGCNNSAKHLPVQIPREIDVELLLNLQNKAKYPVQIGMFLWNQQYQTDLHQL